MKSEIIVQEADGKLVIKVPKTRQSNRSVDIPTVLLNELYRRKQELDEAKQANPLLWETESFYPYREILTAAKEV